jgi:hypothetical protein
LARGNSAELDQAGSFRRSPTSSCVWRSTSGCWNCGPHVYLANLDLVDYSAWQRFSRSGDLLIAEIPLAQFGGPPSDIHGILAFGDGEGRQLLLARPVPGGKWYRAGNPIQLIVRR